jgi:YrbI family 3-deoxy-D-manno-octulosonate 8-phosphate phosphatase
VTKEKVLAVVPARGGSKGIPRKNIRDFAGHPLIAYSIAAGLQAEGVDRTVVSTDNAEIAAVAKEYGAEVPFLRPEHFAQDETPDLPVFKHALEWLFQNEKYHPDVVIQLRPTSPLRPPDCVDRALTILLSDQSADSVRGVIPSTQNPYKMWRMSEEGYLISLMDKGFDEPYNMPRQKLPATYWQTGHIDAIRSETILEKGSMTGGVIRPLLIDPLYSVDIDTERDWKNAERLIQTFGLPHIRPGHPSRQLPTKVEFVLLDFDGVITDNRVWVDASGNEWVAANRSDGWGIARLKEKGIRVVVVSTETNPVVTARCQKLDVEVHQGLEDKARAVEALLKDEKVDPGNVVFLGNDENDIPAFSRVACAVVVADAHPSALTEADIILKARGGQGAVRELCDLIIHQMEAES